MNDKPETIECAYCGDNDYARTPGGDESVVWCKDRLYCSVSCLENAQASVL
jgi:hypothetical protein